MRIILETLKSTQTEWLSVLPNIGPPDLQRLSHTSKTILKLSIFQNLPLKKDILEYPPIRLRSRHPIWRTDTLEEPIRLWKKQWKLVESRNKTLVTDPTIKVPGWELTGARWTALNRIRTEQGRCNYLLHKWGMADSPLCECGDIQSINHIVQSYPTMKFEGGLVQLHEGGPAVAKWLDELTIRLWYFLYLIHLLWLPLLMSLLLLLQLLLIYFILFTHFDSNLFYMFNYYDYCFDVTCFIY